MLRLKKLVSLNQRGANILVTSFKCNSTVPSVDSGSDSERIVLPKAIKRGPTDVLTALARTIGRDPTASHYKYHDDPYLTPYSEGEKKGFALAMEAGRKTAQWIKREHANLFEVCFSHNYLPNDGVSNRFIFIFVAYDRPATGRSIYADQNVHRRECGRCGHIERLHRENRFVGRHHRLQCARDQ